MRPGRPPARSSRSTAQDGGRIVLARVRSGSLRVRDRVAVGGRPAEKVTSLRVFDRGRLVTVDEVPAGRIAAVTGWSSARIGDRFGATTAGAATGAGDGPRRAVLPADPGDRRRRGAARRRRPDVCRPHRARRPGPADRPAAGRRPPRDRRVALRRGAEGGHRGRARGGVRRRGDLPADDEHLRRTGARPGVRGPADRDRPRTRSSPRWGCGSSRCRSAPATSSPSRSSSGRCPRRSSRPCGRGSPRRSRRASAAGRCPTPGS